jgi:hypothetical protein
MITRKDHQNRLVMACIVLGLIVAILTNSDGNTLWELLTGWIGFFRSNIPRMTMDPSAIVFALVVLCILTLTVHVLFSRRSAPAAEGQKTGRRWPFRATLALVGLIIVAFSGGLAAVGIRMELPRLANTAKSPGNNRRFSSESSVLSGAQNRLKQVGIAASLYYSQDSETLPMGTTYDQNGRAMHGWHFALLPFVEQGNIYNSIDQTKPWNHPGNDGPYHREVSVFLHPVVPSTLDAAGYPITTYAANVHVLGGEQPQKIAEFKKGAANVLLIGEMAGNYRAWGYPQHLRDPKLGLNRTPNGFGGPWKAGTNFVMADGSLRTIRDDADPEFLKLLAEPGKE